jgi:hypothetical protein
LGTIISRAGFNSPVYCVNEAERRVMTRDKLEQSLAFIVGLAVLLATALSTE